MNIAITFNGTIQNVIIAADLAAAQMLFPNATVFEAGPEHGIGYIDDGGGNWIAPDPVPDPIPHEVSRYQIMTGLAVAGWITEQEALDALETGARPAAVEGVIVALPEDQRFAARMKWAGFRAAYRDDPLVLALAQAEGKTPGEVDDFFRLCASIE